jgi:predicted unusual protein kinase regulating ubiquinone biosynthesis (AarF/ABC1/UbiB family)
MMEVGGLVSDFDAPRRLPAEYLRKLQELQDRVPAFPTDEALRRVEASLGLRNFTDVFTLLVDEPVAAASIGQVYKAKLRNGKVVALKVQRPDCERVVALDLFVLRWWARLGTSFFVRARTRRGNSKVTRSS